MPSKQASNLVNCYANCDAVTELILKQERRETALKKKGKIWCWDNSEIMMGTETTKAQAHELAQNTTVYYNEEIYMTAQTSCMLLTWTLKANRLRAHDISDIVWVSEVADQSC